MMVRARHRIAAMEYIHALADDVRAMMRQGADVMRATLDGAS